MKIAIMVEIMAAMRTAAAVTKAFKIFKKGAIIAAGEKTITMITRTSRKSGIASFNKKKKYI